MGSNLKVLRKETNGAGLKRLEILERWFAKWLAIHPNHPVNPVQQAVYLEALEDLTPQELEMGCRCATKTCDFFPRPSQIMRAAIEWQRGEGNINTRPDYLDRPKPIESMTEEDKKACDEYSQKVRATLANPDLFRNEDGSHTERCLCHQCRRRRNA